MKRLLLLLLLLPLFFSCDKFVFSSTGTGTIRFTNASSDSYKIYIGADMIKELPGHSSPDETVAEGLFSIKAEQSTGIVSTPNIFKTSIVIESGMKEFRFP